MKKVEVYFIIYLATIISFFALEGEVTKYKNRQNDILLQVAKDKIGELVKIERNLNNSEAGLNLRLDFMITGSYNPENLDAKFVLYKENSDKSPNTTIFKFPLIKNPMEKLWYYIDRPLSEFGNNMNDRYNAKLEFSFLPNITPETLLDWGKAFGDGKIARKIKNNIESKGKIDIIKNLTLEIIPSGGGQPTEFVLEPYSTVFNAIKGLRWEIPIFVGGVLNKDDFNLHITKGKSLVEKTEKGFPYSVLSGFASSSGIIEIRGTRNSDGWSASFPIELNIVLPEWENPTSVEEIYINETDLFDGRLVDVSQSRISMQVTGSLFPKLKKYPGARIPFGPFKKEGNYTIQMLVDGNLIKGMSHTIEVKTPPPPIINYLEKKGHILLFQIIAAGKGNKIKSFSKKSGIANKAQINRKPEAHRTVELWEVTISKPKPGKNRVIVKFSVKDNYNRKKEYEKPIKY